MTTTDTRWRNWASTAAAHPRAVARPRTDEDLARLVGEAAAGGRRMRAVGSGHSFTDCAVTTGTSVDLSALDRIEWVGPPSPDGSRPVRIGAGITLRRLCVELAERGLALANMGDIDAQTLAGAVSTGTHGTGERFTGFAGMVEHVRIVTADGAIRDTTPDSEPDLFEAARLGVGSLGVITALTLRAVPAFVLHAHEAPRPLAAVLEGLADPDGPVRSNDHFEFYWFPHTDLALTKANNLAAADDLPLPTTRRLLDDELLSNGLFAATNELCTLAPGLTPWVNRIAARALGERTYTAPSHAVFVTPRRVRFREMEYAIGAADLAPALARVRAWLDRRRAAVPFPIEVRFAAADDVWLSTAFGRRTAYVAVHQNLGLEFREYFRAVEAIMADFGGRPHWGKIHWLRRADLAELYPRFGDFLAVRDRVDPHGVFANRYTGRVFDTA
ncbi:D-arabinono-1,4-lactone oxidase [Pseudactinotalea sp. HY158]|uniref:D-arabinono-1,4-lactone oxidase n=1 Tax=Pseudactinotalea sp. HY158 TaxID=2654547 RepID=UPI00129C2039|nr:D-arabinono-1,4-lactone oxidase [Pseudactinotalea sp. HY158]QGH70553.1 FAD-binding protein [Pseudactinotalea sp. HY158]